MIEVLITSKPKGGNPGANARVLVPGKEPIDVYVKYCPGSNLPKNHALVSKHQPIYEALTCAIAEQLGLEIPLVGVLENISREKVSFNDISNPKNNHFKFNEDFYFISKLLQGKESDDQERIKRLMAEQKIYRDLLRMHDLSGRRQNLYFPNDGSKIVYLDMGCSFVDAIEGKLKQRMEISRLPLDKKSVRNSKKSIDKIALENARGIRVNMGELVGSIQSILLHVNYADDKRVSELISKEECDYIRDLYTVAFDELLTNYPYKKDPRVLLK